MIFPQTLVLEETLMEVYKHLVCNQEQQECMTCEFEFQKIPNGEET